MRNQQYEDFAHGDILNIQGINVPDIDKELDELLEAGEKRSCSHFTGSVKSAL
ncbi:hypothetical protein GMJAKD_12110 [Candidatus Electrothrix aarhusensis]